MAVQPSDNYLFEYRLGHMVQCPTDKLVQHPPEPLKSLVALIESIDFHLTRQMFIGFNDLAKTKTSNTVIVRSGARCYQQGGVGRILVLCYS